MILQQLRKAVPPAWRALVVSLALTGCALVDAKEGEAQESEQVQAKPAQKQTELQQELARGYALLFELVSSLQHADELFMVKVESDDVQAVTDDVAQAMTETIERLEAMASTSSFDLEDTGTPRFAQETREAMARSRIKSFAPFVGKTGVEFERTLLLTQSGGLNQMRHLTEVLADVETDSDRKRILADADERFDTLYGRVSELLNAQYYCKP